MADLGFYINLDRRTDRNERILEILKENNITGVERYSARHDKGKPPQESLVNTTFDIYKKFLSTDNETLLILEDDCLFLPTIKENTKEIFENIYSLDWDIFWLGGTNRKPPLYVANKCYQVSSPSYAQSYMIRKELCKYVLEHFENDWCNLGIDEMLCLAVYGWEVAKNPFGLNFYKSEQPLNDFPHIFTALTYECSFTTQYNSWSDLLGLETTLENWIPRNHPKPYIE